MVMLARLSLQTCEARLCKRLHWKVQSIVKRFTISFRAMRTFSHGRFVVMFDVGALAELEGRSCLSSCMHFHCTKLMNTSSDVHS